MNYSNNVEEDPSEAIRIANLKYTARLRRRKSEPGNVLLKRFDEDPQHPKGEEESVFEDALQVTSPHFCIAVRIPLSHILVDKRVKILKIEKSSENGRNLVRMDYRVVKDSAGNRTIVYTGWVDLDPSLCWCIVQQKEVWEQTNKGTRATNSEFEVVEREIVNHPSGFPLMKRGSVRFTQHLYGDKEKRINGLATSDFTWEVNDHVPDSEFTLAAYGLPEPGSEPMKEPIPLFVWILVAAGICAALALGFRYLARRRALPRSAT